MPGPELMHENCKERSLKLVLFLWSIPPSDQQGCAGDILLCAHNKLEEATKAAGTEWTAIVNVQRRTAMLSKYLTATTLKSREISEQ